MAVPFKKSPTGIAGLDEVTNGGFPYGRPTLVCGGAGTGKTVLGIEFLVRGATMFDEPGVFVSFEEFPEDILSDFSTLDFPLASLIKKKKLLLDHVLIERHDVEEVGEFDLGGLFVRLDHAIKKIGAKRVVLDNVEALFSAFSNVLIIRAELRRLLEWLRDREVTILVTAESSAEQLTRQGIEAYVCDCVVFLDQRVREHVATRRLRIVKYRGSDHGTNEYPFFVARSGIVAVPITSSGLVHVASTARISSGLPDLDRMLGGKGFYRDSTVLISGSHGSGKSSLTATMVDAAARRGERCLYFSFEESESQIVRGMNSIGIKLAPSIKSHRLAFHCSRPTLFGVEGHLATMLKSILDFKPKVVVVDPINNLMTAGSEFEVRGMLMRLADFLKMRGITAVFTYVSGDSSTAVTESHISSLMDAWICLRDVNSDGSRFRLIDVLEARGIAHSTKVRQFILSNHGIKLLDVYGAER